MLESLLKRDDVTKILDDICNSARYYEKKISNPFSVLFNSKNSQLLFLVYDALYKYSVLINDIKYFDDFLFQIDKLIRKLDNIDDISNGINKSLCSIISCEIDCYEDDVLYKKKFIKYVYKQFKDNGFCIYGYNLYNSPFIRNSSLYDDFLKIIKILKKRKYDVLYDNLFLRKFLPCTNSFFSACCSSVNSPMLFLRIFSEDEGIYLNKNIVKLSNNSYLICIHKLNKFMNDLKLNSYEKSLFLNYFNKEWEILKKQNDNISLILIPNKIANSFDISLSDFLKINISKSTDEIINYLFSNRSILINNDILNNKDLKYCCLNGYLGYANYSSKESIVEEFEKTFISGPDDFAFLNVYGKVTLLVIIGSIFITVGVILTIANFS